MRTSDRGVIAILAHEGVVPAPYKDSKGVWTFGVGHTAAAGDPNPATMPKGMPGDLDAGIARAFEVFRRDLVKYETAVALAIKVPVAQHEFDAAVSFHFNTGAIHRATWVKTLNAGDHRMAAAQIMAWSKPPEIIQRRAAEQRLFRDGVYPSHSVNVWQADTAGKVIWKTAKQLLPSEALALMRGGAPDVDPPAPRATEIPTISPIVAFFRAIAALFTRI